VVFDEFAVDGEGLLEVAAIPIGLAHHVEHVGEALELLVLLLDLFEDIDGVVAPLLLFDEELVLLLAGGHHLGVVAR